MTTTADLDQTMTLTFDAATLAKGWLSVALASGKDDELPVLSKTILIETFPTGVRLIATDRYILLRSWIPADLDALEPALDEAPDSTAIAADTQGRARNLLGHVLRLAAAAEADSQPAPTLRLTVNQPEDDDPQMLALDGVQVAKVILEYPAHERVKLSTVEGRYPAWRSLAQGMRNEKTHRIALNPEIIDRLAELRRYHPTRPLIWTFGGAERAAGVEVADTMPEVCGLVMPVRLNDMPSAQ